MAKSLKQKNRKWRIFAIICFIIEILMEIWMFYHAAMQKMIPNKYILILYIALILITVITAFCLFKGRKPTKGRTAGRVIGVILVIAISFVSIVGSSYLSIAVNMLKSITADENETGALIGVYVLSDDPAQSIEDAASYTFGIMETMDRVNTDQAVSSINNKLGTSINTSPYPSMIETAQALYDGQVQAAILNESFADTLSETDGYTDFAERTRRIDEISIQKTNSESQETIENITETPFILYISGSDTRNTMLDVSRSDVNILMAVNPVTKQILLLNTPRDYYVANPAGGGAMDKLTHLGLYGIDNSMQGLSSLYNVNISQYMQINFTGFERLIDAIGGITVYSDTTFTSNEGYTFYQGENTMDGAKALSFARDRYHQAAGDNDRGRHQMMVIEAVISKLTSNASTLLTNYADIMNSLSGMFLTSLSSDQISELIQMQLNDNASWNVKSYAVTGTGGNDYTYSMPSVTAYVMYQDADMVAHASSLLQKVLNGETITDSDL